MGRAGSDERMGYVIAGILVVLIVAAAITFFVRAAMTRKGQATIAAPDEGTPVGDTDQHAGEQSREGATASDPEATERTSEATKPSSPGIGGVGEGGIGGEAEGSRHVPNSEDLADRPR
jgi:hypothetical protein